MDEVLPEYGTCPCGGTYDRRTVQVTLPVAGEEARFTGVPQGACPTCGSRIYKRSVIEVLEQILRQG